MASRSYDDGQRVWRKRQPDIGEEEDKAPARRWGRGRGVAGSASAGAGGKGGTFEQRDSKGAGKADLGAAAYPSASGESKAKGKGQQAGYSSQGSAKGNGERKGGSSLAVAAQGDDPLRLAALDEYAQRVGGELVDVGVNFGRHSQREVAAQLCRASAARVTCIMLTGTEVSNAQAAERMCSAWGDAGGPALARRTLGAALIEETPALPSLRFTAGVHPNHLRSVNDGTMRALRALAASPFCVAVGECGLDYERMGSSREEQLRWCRQQVELAVELGKPLFLHERERDKGPPLGAAEDLLRILQDCGADPARACIHCFTGSTEQLQEFVRRGYMIGLTGFIGMLRRGGHLRRALQEGALPLGQLVLETDSPYMMPDAPYVPASIGMQPRKMEPAAMPGVCMAAAECFGVSPQEVAQATTANAKRLFGLP